MKKVDVLLASFNGEKYIEEQLNSILNQNYYDIRIIIRDDNSTDQTLEILNKFHKKYPNKISLLVSNKNIGSTSSFFELMKASTSEYIMFCDQDDVWKHDKISNTIETMSTIHSDTPSLVFTDLTVVNNKLENQKESFLKAMKIDAEWLLNSSYKLLCQNPAAGCTIMINSKSRELLLKHGKFPSSIVHDHWMIVFISLVGKVKFLNLPTILYRQHENNQVGAHSIGLKYLLNKFFFSLSSTIRHDQSFMKQLSSIKKFSFTKYVYYKVFTNLKRIN